MKKLFLAYATVIALGLVAIFIGMSYAQEVQPTQQQALTWKKADLEREWAYCQQRLKYIKTEYDTIVAQEKALQSPQAPAQPPAAPKAPPAAPKPEKKPAQRQDP